MTNMTQFCCHTLTSGHPAVQGYQTNFTLQPHAEGGTGETT